MIFKCDVVIIGAGAAGMMCAIEAGGAAGKDFYTLNIIKTGNAAFTVLGNVSNFA